MKTLLFISIFLIAGSCSTPDSGFDPAREKILIENAINGSIGWAKDKNLAWLYNVISNDSAFLEIHPGGRIVRGFDEFRKSEKLWMDPAFRAIRYEIRDLRITISSRGDAAWWFCILDDITEWKGQSLSWENTRWTGVLEKRDNRWVIVQQHFSFAQ